MTQELTYSEEYREQQLQNIDLCKHYVTVQYNGSMGGYGMYEKLTDRAYMEKILKEDWGIYVSENTTLVLIDNPTDWEIDIYVEGGLRLYVAELWLDEEGNDIVDFCVDYVCETNEKFDKLIEELN